MISTLVSTLIFILGLIVGFFVGRKSVPIDFNYVVKEVKENEKLKVLHKSDPKTFEEKRSEALDKDKPMIKTFYK